MSIPLLELSMSELKERAAAHGITAPAGDQGEKATWIAAIQQAEGSGGGWKPDVGAEWEVVDGRMGVGRYYHTAAVHGGTICTVGGVHSPDTVEVYNTTTKV